MGKKLIALFLGTTLLPLGSITASAEETPTSIVYEGEWVTASGEYTYPITPSDKAWADMNYPQMVEACNMPQALVETLSTEDLVKAALDYPLKLDYLMFDSYTAGIEHLKDTSNVYRESYTREDAAEALLAAYDALQVDYAALVSDTVENPMQASGYDKELILQLLLASDEVFDCMSETQTTALVEIIGEKYEEKEGKCDDFSTALTFYSVLSENNDDISEKLIPANIYENMAVNAAAATGFVSSGKYASTSIGSYVEIGKYEKYGTSCGADDCYKYISGDYSIIEAAGINGTYLGTHPDWTFKSDATKKYNCHSYCWIDKSYSNIYWLNNPTNYTNATSYFANHGTNVKITSSNSYIVLYDSTGPIHSVRSNGVSSGNSLAEWMTSVMAESKLGSAGVYETTLYDMIYFYNAGSYKVYTEK